ncbi:hypothetical protein G7K_2243-t1 [Saitoella complicata NRRL Y-17804]|uniref:Uncharacterized protein n=1 Tax=Saitoella complicata (strain BCRC 22490 / CBS 7301 / JCM 7358 / NBRC 10748 / NRRL Y-17804) TaxID=698492 RepID=A0A0E9NF77_SAICN|nr:hypothetical protein G7K_2243-t1 [Saitoella complicata NRRL Y-17804]
MQHKVRRRTWLTSQSNSNGAVNVNAASRRFRDGSSPRRCDDSFSVARHESVDNHSKAQVISISSSNIRPVDRHMTHGSERIENISSSFLDELRAGTAITCPFSSQETEPPLATSILPQPARCGRICWLDSPQRPSA